MTTGRRFVTTSAGVQIGRAYQRPMPTMDRDSERLQRALLDQRTNWPLWLQLVTALAAMERVS